MWNDWDDDGDPIAAVLDSGPAQDPAFTLSGDGSFTYTPPPGWTGTDGFTYHVSDGMDVSETVGVEIGVLNWAPVAEDDPEYAMQHDQSMTVPAEEGVLQNDYDPDGDPFWAVLDTGPTHAQSFALSSDGSFSYTPTPGCAGEDSFTYYPTDGIDDGEIATATIAVMNWPPMVGDDGPYMVATGGSFTADPPGLRENDWDPDGDDFALAVETGPSHGTLTHFDDDLNSDGEGDGGFTYTAVLGYTGADSFTYRADDGVPYGQSEPATVSIDVVLPEPDIDTDSDNNGIIDGTQYEDDEEMKDPGRLVYYNSDDDNGNGVQDRLEPGPLVDASGQPVNDDDLKPATLAIDPLEADLTGFSLQLATGANTKLFETQDKQPLALSYTIGTDQIPTEIYVEGYDYGQSQVDWILKNPAGAEVNRDTVKFAVVRVDLTAYRPITEQAYGAPFPRTKVPWQEEGTPGAGIRRNGDDDNDNGTPDWNETSVANENDLIEVEVFSRPVFSPGIGYSIERSTPAIKVWGSSTKGNLYLDSDVPVPIAGGDYSMWVEYDPGATQPSDLIYGVWDTTHNQRVFSDSVHFSPFTSVVIAFGGWDAVPLDVNSGAFQMAIDLYARGYDVHAYNERTLDQPDPTAAHREVISAVDERGVQQVATFGHSYGGGGVYELLTRLGATPPQGNFTVPFTAYIEGIVWNTWTYPPERNLPPGSQYHVNYYQTNNSPQGAAVPGANFNLDVTTTTWGAALVHTTIDNDLTVRTRILDGSTAGGSEGPHAGLTQRVNR